jgi:hypothetical protein
MSPFEFPVTEQTYSFYIANFVLGLSIEMTGKEKEQ